MLQQIEVQKRRASQEFIKTENMAIQIERQAKLQADKSLKSQPDIDRFPFTNGDAVENRRAQIAAERKQEMRQQLAALELSLQTSDEEESEPAISRISVRRRSVKNLPPITES